MVKPFITCVLAVATLKANVETFAPDLIFLDGIHGGVTADTLHQCLNVPLVTRSHNIEHLYYQRILKSAVGFKQKLKRYCVSSGNNGKSL